VYDAENGVEFAEQEIGLNKKSLSDWSQTGFFIVNESGEAK